MSTLHVLSIFYGSYFPFISCRFDNEQPFKKAAEEEISSLHKVIDDADLTKTDLDSQIESLRLELQDLERNHEEVSATFI